MRPFQPLSDETGAKAATDSLSGQKRKGGLPVGQGVSQNPDSEAYRLLHDNSEMFVWLVRSLENETKRAILYTLAHMDTAVTYSDIEPFASTSKRTIRKHTQQLEQHGVVDAGGYPVSITFATPDIEVVAREALALVD